MIESHYYKTLEYSSKKSTEGVTFEELCLYLEKNYGIKFNAKSMFSFFKFVLETHYWSDTKLGANNSPNHSEVSSFYNYFKVKFKLEKIDVSGRIAIYKLYTEEEKYFLNGEGDKRLYEFYELREARKNAKQAYCFSIAAIVISLLALLFTPLIDKLWSLILCTP